MYLRGADAVKTTCAVLRYGKGSWCERGRTECFTDFWPTWDFHTQPSRGFTESLQSWSGRTGWTPSRGNRNSNKQRLQPRSVEKHLWWRNTAKLDLDVHSITELHRRIFEKNLSAVQTHVLLMGEDLLWPQCSDSKPSRLQQQNYLL